MTALPSPRYPTLARAASARSIRISPGLTHGSSPMRKTPEKHGVSRSLPYLVGLFLSPMIRREKRLLSKNGRGFCGYKSSAPTGSRAPPDRRQPRLTSTGPGGQAPRDPGASNQAAPFFKRLPNNSGGEGVGPEHRAPGDGGWESVFGKWAPISWLKLIFHRNGVQNKWHAVKSQ